MDEVPEAVDMAVRLMTPQETSLVSAAARYAFDGRSERPEMRLSFQACSGQVACCLSWSEIRSLVV